MGPTKEGAKKETQWGTQQHGEKGKEDIGSMGERNIGNGKVPRFCWVFFEKTAESHVGGGGKGVH